LIEWNTLSEVNNDYFVVEHSSDGRNFTSVSKIFSNGDNGSNYSYIHMNRVQGINYYRLRSVDKNKRAEYSSVRKVAFGKNDLVLTTFPNPAKGKVTLMINVNENEKSIV
jgi:hypothetical protein